MWLSDPDDVELDGLLRSFDPWTELAARYALRANFRNVDVSIAFSRRIDELFLWLRPNPQQLVLVMEHATRLGIDLPRLRENDC